MNGRSGLGAGASWHKAHGLGNDYLVFEEGDDWPLTPGAVAAVCHRTRGVGSDGIVLRLAGSDVGAQRLRMFNPDGTEFERSGNGLRIFAAYRATRGEVATGAFDVEVGGDRVRLEVLEREGSGLYQVRAAMGPARFGAGAVGSSDQALEGLKLGGPVGEVADLASLVPVSVGNPHAVVFPPDLDEALLNELGPYLTDHRAFPEGVNVQLARPDPPSRLHILIWERGVGRTSASGTSSCASAAAAVHTGRLDPGEIEVVMEGGSLRVTVEEGYEITLEGPVQNVAQGELTPDFLRHLQTAQLREK